MINTRVATNFVGSRRENPKKGKKEGMLKQTPLSTDRLKIPGCGKHGLGTTSWVSLETGMFSQGYINSATAFVTWDLKVGRVEPGIICF